MLKEKQSSIGNGEVESSILSGSTTDHYKISGFSDLTFGPIVAIAQNDSRTAQPNSGTIRGLCSADVPPDDDLACARGLAIAGLIALPLWAAFLIAIFIHFGPSCSGRSTIDGRDLCADHTTARDVPGLTK